MKEKESVSKKGGGEKDTESWNKEKEKKDAEKKERGRENAKEDVIKLSGVSGYKLNSWDNQEPGS